MAKVLIVDSDSRNSMTLGLALTARGHVVHVETDGRAAVERGLCFRPEVLLIDAVLDGPLNGLEVSEALRAVRQELHAIVTADAGTPNWMKRTQLAAFFNKPLQLDPLDETINQIVGEDGLAARLSVHYVEFSADQTIQYANAAARRALRLPDLTLVHRTLGDLFDEHTVSRIEQGGKVWIQMSRKGVDEFSYFGRVKSTELDSNLLFFINRGDEDLLNDPIIETLVD